jgi:predicted transcriptional regulator
MSDRDPIRIVADRIRRHFDEHPNASDTAKGIGTWWLTGVSESVVQEALDELVCRGFVRREEVTGGSPQFLRASGH